MAFEWSSIPWWVWVLLVAATAVVLPIKLRIFKNILRKQQERDRPVDEE